MRRWLFLILFLVPACPSSSSVDAGGDAPTFDGGGIDGGGVDGGGLDGGGLDGGGSDGGGSGALGDCGSDADCGAGGQCIELVPGGYRVCRTPVVEATSCDPSRTDDCCRTADCTGAGEICVLGPVRRFCGGAKRLPFNECAADECETSADCAGGVGAHVCAPAGTFGPVSRCVTGSCLTDADCDAAANGHCVVFTDPCCSIRTGLFCTYGTLGDGTACRASSDCTSGYCGVEADGVAACRPGGPICPG